MAGIFSAGWIGNRKLMGYPNAFFNPLTFAAPDVKALFEWCEFFALSDGIVNSIISKMAIYPVTRITVSPENDKMAKKIQEMFDAMDITSFLMKVNTQYFTYGNVFASVMAPTTRLLECSNSGCHKTVPFDSVKRIKMIDYKFVGVCPKCHNETSFKIRDIKIIQPTKAKIVLWNPKHITIDPAFMGYQNKYYYDISANFADKIGAFSFDSSISMGTSSLNTSPKQPGIENFLKNIPTVVIKALKEKKSIVFDTTNLIHLELPGMPGWYSPWGMPLILPALRDLYFYYIVRKAQELVIRERLLSYRVVFPMQSSGTNPAEMIGLGRLMGQVRQAFKEWRADPNIVQMFPYPLGYQMIGGEKLPLPLERYTELLEKRIIAAMKAPYELIFGGLQWSGSSIDLRMFENMVLNLRNTDIMFLNFVKNRMLTTYFDIPQKEANKIKVGMTDLRMADDVQRQQIYMNLADKGTISETTLLRELGKDFKLEQKQRFDDLTYKRRAFLENAKITAEGQVLNSVITAKGQVETQVEAHKAQIVASSLGLNQTDIMYTPPHIRSLLDTLAQASEKERQTILDLLKNTMPVIYGEISKILSRQKSVGGNENAKATQTQPQKNQKPLPEQKPPRRGSATKTV